MKKLFVCLVFLILTSLCSHAQITSRSLGMGNFSTVFYDHNSLFLNPAGLAAVKEAQALATTEQFYFIDGINRSGGGIILPVDFGSFGLAVSTFGFSEFRQQKIAVNYARKLMKNVRLGARFSYFQTRIPEYGSAGKISFDIGLQANLTDDLLIATYISNPQQNENTSGAELPTNFTVGLAYVISTKITTAFELEKDIEFPVRFKFGFDYTFLPKFSVRMGYSSDPSNYHFGIGLQLNESLVIDIGNRYDQTLGLTPGLTLGYTFQRR